MIKTVWSFCFIVNFIQVFCIFIVCPGYMNSAWKIRKMSLKGAIKVDIHVIHAGCEIKDSCICSHWECKCFFKYIIKTSIWTHLGPEECPFGYLCIFDKMPPPLSTFDWNPAYYLSKNNNCSWKKFKICWHAWQLAMKHFKKYLQVNVNMLFFSS